MGGTHVIQIRLQLYTRYSIPHAAQEEKQTEINPIPINIKLECSFTLHAIELWYRCIKYLKVMCDFKKSGAN